MATLPRRSEGWTEPQRARVIGADTPRGQCLVRELRRRGVDVAEVPGDPRPDATHVFLTGGGENAQSAVLEEARGLENPPRIVLCSSQSARLGFGVHRRCEERLRTSGLPFTIARPSLALQGTSAPPLRLAARCLELVLALVRILTLGSRGHALRPMEVEELAFGLAHTGLGFSTIGRTVQGQELRRIASSARSYDEPMSRRDGPRH